MIYLHIMHFMNNNSIILGQITVGLTLQLKTSVELVLRVRQSGSESPHVPLGLLELHAVPATFLLFKGEKKAKHEFSIHRSGRQSLGKVNKYTFTGGSATRGHSKPSGSCYWDPPSRPMPPASPLVHGHGWHRSPAQTHDAFLMLLAPPKTSQSASQKEAEIARSQGTYVLLRKRGQRSSPWTTACTP